MMNRLSSFSKSRSGVKEEPAAVKVSEGDKFKKRKSEGSMLLPKLDGSSRVSPVSGASAALRKSQTSNYSAAKAGLGALSPTNNFSI